MTLADVLRRHGPDYLRKYGSRMPASHRAAIDAILRCHTPASGGSLYVCDDCGKQHFAYHRCGHRACPQCGHAHAQAWLEAQTERLLPVGYFLVTFTVPEPLRALYAQVPREVWRKSWVVHCQYAGRGKEALSYLSRYIYKTAISSTRLLSQDDQNVTFSYRESGTGEERITPLPAEEFLRRFLQHVLPRGFRRVRSYGWLSPAAKARFEQVCIQLNASCTPKPMRLKVAIARVECPHCKKAMRRIAEFSRAPT